jgi:hypothetical protein
VKPSNKAHAEKNQLFIEQRPQGDYAVRRPNSKRASAIEPTQAKAEKRARQLEPDAVILPARVRHTSKGKPDQWRKGDK